MVKVYFLDHYDSFSDNVIDWLANFPKCQDVQHIFSDRKDLATLDFSNGFLVLSPGPNSPEDNPQSLELVNRVLGRVPILGVCLGHQILGTVAGLTIELSSSPMHGNLRSIDVIDHRGIFAKSPPCLSMASYHSLVVAGSPPKPWHITARCKDGEIQALERFVPGEPPTAGVQFHPESFLSEGSQDILERWFEMVELWHQGGKG
jgi:anthranilate synthase/aminodeoxychorismate synthase-like glutamine amidotransferase